MKLSDRTLQVLKNYASINPNIVFEPGNQLKTISAARNVLSKTELNEEIPSKFGIYDLNEFLSVLSLVDQPDLSFEKDYVLISDSTGRSKIKYFFSDPDMLTTPNRDVTMPESEVSFTLDTKTLSSLKSAASVLGHNEISVSSAKGAINLSVVDNKDSTSNTFSVQVEGSYPENVDFNFVINVNNLKLLNEDFDVFISSKLISEFKSKQSSIQYFIAVEKTSTYGE